MYKIRKLWELDFKALSSHSIFELLIPFMIIPVMIFYKSFLVTSVLIIMLTVANIEKLNRGLSFVSIIFYSYKINILFIYISIKYVAINLFYVSIVLLLYTTFDKMNLFIVFVSITNVCMILLSVYFLILFYLIESFELNLFTNTILFFLGFIAYFGTLFLFNLLGIYSLLIIGTETIIYFVIIIPIMVKIFFLRIGSIMENII